jgi:hypothetical protein
MGSLVDHFVNNRGSSRRPLLERHRLVRDQILAEHMFHILNIAPPIGIAVLQPNKRSSNISWNVFLVVDDDRLFAPSRHEDFDGIVVIAEATLVERTLNALISP